MTDVSTSKMKEMNMVMDVIFLIFTIFSFVLIEGMPFVVGFFDGRNEIRSANQKSNY